MDVYFFAYVTIHRWYPSQMAAGSTLLQVFSLLLPMDRERRWKIPHGMCLWAKPGNRLYALQAHLVRTQGHTQLQRRLGTVA